MSTAHKSPTGGSKAAASPRRPLRVNDVHDLNVRRIATITPDIISSMTAEIPAPAQIAKSPRRCPNQGTIPSSEEAR
jgi:hypothetical protein